MKIIRKIINFIFASNLAQRSLEYILKVTTYLMGVGAGSDVFESGEEAIFNELIKHKNVNNVVFDVGANKGQFLSLTKKKLGKTLFQVHCFEPSIYTFEVLKKNHPLPTSNIFFNNFGMGAKTEKLILKYDKKGSGLASLTKRDLSFKEISYEMEEEVEIRSIDEYCLENNISEINLLKIDVEGHELDVILGAKNMLKNKKIEMISFEFGGCNIDTKTFFKHFYNFFTPLGFVIYRITPYGFLFEIKEYKESYEQFRTTNFIAVLM